MNTGEIDSVLGRDSLSSMIFGGEIAADEFGRLFLTLPPFFCGELSQRLTSIRTLVACVPFFFLLCWVFYSYGLPIEMYPSIQSIVGQLSVTNSLTQLQDMNTDVC